MVLSAVEVNKGPGHCFKVSGKQMTNAVVFLVRTVSNFYNLSGSQSSLKTLCIVSEILRSLKGGMLEIV